MSSTSQLFRVPRLAVRQTDYWVTVLKRTWRGSVISSFLMPFLYLTAMGVGLGSFVDTQQGEAALGGVTYLAFIAPGLLATTAMMTAVGESTYPIMGGFKWHRVYYSMAATPLDAVDIVLAQLAFIAFRIAITCAVFLGVVAAYGALHNWPGLPVQHFMTGPGPRLAGGAFFDIRITGKGAHGARPHESIDPVMVACTLANALQSIVSRNVSAMDTAVLSVTRVQAGDAYNVIPQTATLSGTVRAFRREVMTLIEQNMGRLSTAIASGFGADATLDFRLLFAPTVNDADQFVAYADAAAELVG